MPNPKDVERVQRLFRALSPSQVLDIGELTQKLGPPRLGGRRLAAVLRSLAKRREVVQIRGRGFHARPSATTLEGELVRRVAGHGQIRTDAGPVYAPASELSAFIDGDRVRARLDYDRRGRPFARGLELTARRNRHLIGAVRHIGAAILVEAEDGSYGDPVLVEGAIDVDEGDLVEVEISPPPSQRGRVVRHLGTPGKASLEVARIVVNHGIELDHPTATIAEAERASEEIPDAERARRVDLRDLPLVTIDGADACDFDDAVFAERDDEGYRLVVAIADVAHYVVSGSHVDREARRRGTSVYWPGGVAHMLPERLAADLCSLGPGVERRAVAADLLFDPDGSLREATLFEAIVQSRARLTYDQVNAALRGEPGAAEALGPSAPLVATMGDLAAVLEEQLNRGGRLDLDLPEPHFVLDDAGEPEDAFPRPMGPAERLIEGFMVAANRAVARWCEARTLPCLYRVHERPTAEKLALFAETAQSLVGARLGETPSARSLSHTLGVVARPAERRLLSYLLLRSLPQARYDSRPLGHYGLGIPDYLHFTSPIRRYPDLLVHRALKADLAGRRPRKEVANEVNAMAPQLNERERAAMGIERTIDAMLSATLAKRRVGERFEGTVVGVEGAGLFVAVERPLFEGFLPARLLRPEDYYRRTRDGLSLVGRRRRHHFRLGDPITVDLEAVDLAKRRIDLNHVDAR